MERASFQKKDSEQVFKANETKAVKNRVFCETAEEGTKQGTPNNIKGNFYYYPNETSFSS